MEPSKKNTMLTNFLDDFAQSTFGRSRSQSIKGNVCVMCGNQVGRFRDNLSLKEYTISGMCQACQDDFFGGNEDEL